VVARASPSLLTAGAKLSGTKTGGPGVPLRRRLSLLYLAAPMIPADDRRSSKRILITASSRGIQAIAAWCRLGVSVCACCWAPGGNPGPPPKGKHSHVRVGSGGAHDPGSRPADGEGGSLDFAAVLNQRRCTVAQEFAP